MQIDLAIVAVTAFRDAIATAAPEMSFRVETYSNPEPLRRCFRKEIPATGASRLSGVYVITDTAGEILYIGKATTKNLGAEVYSKFGAPVIVDTASDTPRFERSILARWCGDFSLGEKLVAGDVLFFALAIEPAELSSLVEVYLHMWHAFQNAGNLPLLNRRIG